MNRCRAGNREVVFVELTCVVVFVLGHSPFLYRAGFFQKRQP